MSSGAGPRVVSRRPLLSTPVWSAEEGDLEFADGSRHRREVVHHPGAVGVVAYRDGEVLLIEQYRFSVEATMWELPAGLLDVDGEPASHAAARELAEEAQLAAATWHVLVDLHTTPGMSDEATRVFLARDVSAADRPDGFEVGAEEAGITTTWVPLAEAVRRVLAGEVTNSLVVSGVLAAALAEQRGFEGLRPAGAPWSWRPAHSG